MLWGLFKKIVIADRLAIYVNTVYNNAEHHNGNTLVVATIFFAFQIYCDFSGYSDIAIGAARVMGFKLMTNFNRPYFSRNISEFWKRWHISLSTWFKDYLYISLGGNRVSIPRWYFNLFFVFLVSGLWHGANWTFLIWGGLNGLYLVFALMTQHFRKGVDKVLGLTNLPGLNRLLEISTTFILACFAWIFFRANSVHDAFYIIRKMFTSRGPVYFQEPSMIIYALFGILFLICVEWRQEFSPHRVSLLNNPHWLVRNLACAMLIVLILLIGVFDGGQFIYFQF